MTTTPQQIQAAILASNTTLFTAFIGASSRAMLVSLDLSNTTTVDITVDAWWESADGLTTRYFGKGIVVPASGSASYRGIVVLANPSEKIRAVATATGVNAVGAVMES